MSSIWILLVLDPADCVDTGRAGKTETESMYEKAGKVMGDHLTL